MRELSAVWFPDSEAPKAPALLLEHMSSEILRATMGEVTALLEEKAELGTESAGVGDEIDERLQEQCELLTEHLCMMLDEWDPKAVIAAV